MAQDFLLPDIGEGIIECELVEWLVAEGDVVEEDQPVADVMTDKALVQIPSMHNGVITKLYHQKGEIAKVHAPLFAIEPTVKEQEPVIESGKQIKEFDLPDIGEGIVECEVVEWLVEVGDSIVEDQPIADVMTDKALVQIPAIEAGVITELFCKKGSVAKVHAPLFAYSVEGQAVEPQVSVNATEQSFSIVEQGSSAEPDVTANNQKAIASPAVRRIARERNIDLTTIVGSGKNGRVLKADLDSDITPAVKPDVEPVVEPVAAPSLAAASPVAMPSTERVSHIEPIKGIKAAMAKQMVESVATIPHFTYSEEVDMTDLIALRLSLKETYKEQGVKLTMMPFFVKAMSLALKEFPILNSQLNDDASEIHYLNAHNIGMAVDSKIGLLVPNIKNVAQRSIVDVANEVTRLTDAARAGRLSMDDLSEGTITISNIGALGGTTATPIINKPEVAIVALGKVQNLPRFDANGEVVARSIMQVSWSGDHRVIDGGTIARFCNLWKSYLENPTKMLMVMS